MPDFVVGVPMPPHLLKGRIPSMRRFFSAALSRFAVCWFVGCGQDAAKAPTPVKVSGTVKMDGKAMGGGEVRFALPGQPPKAMPINAGTFAGEAFVGKNNVTVVWEKDGPPHPMDPTARLKVNVVAGKFSGPESPLNAEVGESGASDLKFEVTSERK